MAAFSITFDGTRVDAADSATGWAADGVTPALDGDQFYQGTGSIGAQVKTSDAGYKFTSSSQDLSGSGGRTVLVKMVSGRPGALQGNGISVRMGSSDGSNYYLWSLLSASTYPAVGGWQIMAIDPNVSQWRTSTSGTPNLAAITYWGFRAHYTANTQGRNTFTDAIDHIPNGKGLTGLRGDGGDTDGTFAAFATADQDTSGNRWGIVATRDGILFVSGMLTIGESGTATEFSSSGETLVFPHHRVTTNFCGVVFNIENASTVIVVNGGLFNGRGSLVSSDDTRPRISVVGTSGSLTMDGQTFNGCEQIILTAAAALLACSISNSGQITGAGADLTGTSVSGYTGAVDTSALVWNVNTDPDGLLDDMNFAKGSAAHHAIEFGTTSPTTMTLRGITFTGFNASNNQNDSAIHIKRTTGTVTINIDGGTTPSYKSDGATVVIVAGSVNVAVNVKDTAGSNIQNARVLLKAATGGPFPFETTVAIANSGTTATVTHTGHGLATNDKVLIKGASHLANNGVFSITVTDSNTYTYTMGSSPGSNPTGTIKSTFVALEGLTDANGNISASRVYPSDQPVSGWARKSSAQPFYKEALLGGSVDNVAGYSANVQLVGDE